MSESFTRMSSVTSSRPFSTISQPFCSCILKHGQWIFCLMISMDTNQIVTKNETGLYSAICLKDLQNLHFRPYKGRPMHFPYCSLYILCKWCSIKYENQHEKQISQRGEITKLQKLKNVEIFPCKKIMHDGEFTPKEITMISSNLIRSDKYFWVWYIQLHDQTELPGTVFYLWCDCLI